MCIIEFKQRRFNHYPVKTPFLFFRNYVISLFLKEGKRMKKLEIIIRPEKLENLKAILEGCRVNGIMISNVMGYGNQKGYTQMYRGTKYNVNLLPKVKVETVIPKELADPIIDAVVDEINTGNYGDGKIFVYDVQDAIRIRTGEHGREAL